MSCYCNAMLLSSGSQCPHTCRVCIHTTHEVSICAYQYLHGPINSLWLAALSPVQETCNVVSCLEQAARRTKLRKPDGIFSQTVALEDCLGIYQHLQPNPAVQTALVRTGKAAAAAVMAAWARSLPLFAASCCNQFTCRLPWRMTAHGHCAAPSGAHLRATRWPRS